MMKVVHGFIAGSFLTAMMFVWPISAGALEINKFDQMTPNDKGRYAALLVGNSITWLNGQGRKADGNKVISLFKKNNPDQKMTKGMQAFLNTLDELRQAEEAVGEPIDVEVALWKVLSDEGIEIPSKIMMQFTKDFQPQDIGISSKPGVKKSRGAVGNSEKN